jgi:hypothetical protein
MNQQQNQAPVMSMSDWLITLLISSIPLVNIVMLIVWAVSATGNPNKANWAKAMLIFLAIVFALYFFVFAALIAVMASNF